MAIARLYALLATVVTATACNGAANQDTPTEGASRMTANTPTASRPAPARVPPVVHRGVRYEQNLAATPAAGMAPGGALAAHDDASGKLLWQMQVYTVPDTAPPGLSHPGRYFRAMSLVDGKEQLLIEDETGSRYLVDLQARSAEKISGPPDTAPTEAPIAKPRPE
jgi:hypothetical protein